MASFKFDLGKLLQGILATTALAVQTTEAFNAGATNEEKRETVVNAVLTGLSFFSQFANVKELKTPGVIDALGQVVDLTVALVLPHGENK